MYRLWLALDGRSGDDRLINASINTTPHKRSLASLCNEITHSILFNRIVIASILVGAAVIGLETYPILIESYGSFFKNVDRLILLIFAVEAALKMLSHGARPYRYFLDGWNIFDFSVLILCLIPTGGNYFAVARLARIFRVFRLVSTVPRLQMLVGALFRSVPSMGYIGVLLGLVFYIFSVVGVFAFGSNDPFHFGSLQRALLTLFGVVTLEGWTDVMQIQMYGCNFSGSEMVKALCTDPKAAGWLAPLYFILFVVTGTMIVLNLFIGVVVNSMSETQKEMRGTANKIGVIGDIQQIADKVDDLKNHLERLESELTRKS